MKKSRFLKPCAFALIAFLMLVSPGRGSAKSKSPNKEDPGKVLFDKVQVFKIRIEMEKSAMDQLQKTYTNPVVYVPAKIEQAGQVYDKVGVHLRGVSTFQPVEKKPNFTFKFNEFVPGQKFHGLRKVRFSNAMVDHTYLQEFFAAELFRAGGVATPRVNYARLELNGRDLGLYLLIEGVTHDFLKENFLTTAGNVYEGDETDVDERLEQDYGKRSKYQSDLRPLVLAAKEPDLGKRFKELEKVLDLDPFISMMALEVMIDCWDCYSLRINNYRVFCNHDSGRVTFIPHGLDRTWEDVPAPLMPEMKGLVSKALLETPEGKKRYLVRMRELYGMLLDKQAVRTRLTDITARIKPSLIELDQDKSQARGLLILQRRIDRRIEFIGKQLPLEEAKLK